MAYIYSVTVSLPRPLADEWLAWMQAEHIPEVMATGCFTSHRIARMVEPMHDANVVNFNIQYTCPDALTLDTYRKQHAPALQAAHQARYGDNAHAFRTVLKEL